ncbi:MAG: hypothetical protein JKY80_09310 [Mariprofundaceae bacterium]|nr:hypothetical protein [Mariprofundaceae bacterium]
MSFLGEHFEADARNMSPEELRRRVLLRKQREFRMEAEIVAERQDGNVTALAASATILASQVELKEFSAELEVLDVATIKAITQNNKILQRLYRERDVMLENAHTLEDGTRAFKSVDGERVFDEHGNQLSADVVDPDEILDHLPKAETYLELVDKIDRHEAIADRLSTYQEKLDAAHERVDSGEMTKQELEEYRTTLQSDMPLEIRRQLPDYDPANEKILKTDFTASSNPPQLSAADMAIDPSMVPSV